MNFVDLIILAFALALAAIGYERGLIASGLPLAGFVIGAAIGGRLGPALLAGGGESPYAPLITVLAGLRLGATLAMAMEGFADALSARFSRPGAPTVLDGIGGAALLAALALLLAWAFGAAALNVPGPGERDLRHALQRSRILTALNSALPPSGPLLNVLRHIDPTPAVSGPNANVRAPEPAIAPDPDVKRAVHGLSGASGKHRPGDQRGLIWSRPGATKDDSLSRLGAKRQLRRARRRLRRPGADHGIRGGEGRRAGRRTRGAGRHRAEGSRGEPVSNGHRTMLGVGHGEPGRGRRTARLPLQPARPRL